MRKIKKYAEYNNIDPTCQICVFLKVNNLDLNNIKFGIIF